MIFIGAELSDPCAHFVTNIVACIGAGNDLVIDLLNVEDKEEIFNSIARHLQDHEERYVIYNAYTVEDFFFTLKQRFPQLRLITVFSDDEWRHANYDRYLALYSDVFTIAVKDNVETYQEYGLDAFYMQWACNPEMFHPLPEQKKDIDVSFIGAAYGRRIEYVRFLISNGVNVRVFGHGWDRYADIRPYWGGYLSHQKMLKVVARSKINMNFLWTSAKKERCTIKGRTLELSACQAFQLSNHTDEFANYGFVVGENVAVFTDTQDALNKVQYYLQHDNERAVIAERAYEHVLLNHTWKQRFQQIFSRLESEPSMLPRLSRKYRVVILVGGGIQHQITLEDERLDILFVDPENDWKDVAASADGVVSLGHDSTLNNESLYMMAFGLVADKSDLLAANFYAGGRNKRHWIRFVDRVVEQRRNMLCMLPVTCLMFSGVYAAEHGCALASNLDRRKVSYLEYPSFWVKLSYYQSRILRLYFAYHLNAPQRFKSYIKSLKLVRAMSLGMDVLWQKTMQPR